MSAARVVAKALARETARLLDELVARARRRLVGAPRETGDGDADIAIEEAARRRLHDRLARAQLIARVAPGVAHEIGNHLQVVLGNSELVIAEDLPDSTRKAFARVVEAAERAAALNRQLLLLARGADEAGVTNTASEPTRLGELLDATLPRLARLVGPVTPLRAAALPAEVRTLRLDAEERRLVSDALGCLLVWTRERWTTAPLTLHAELETVPERAERPRRSGVDGRAVLRLRVLADIPASARTIDAVGEAGSRADDVDTSLMFALLELIADGVGARVDIDAGVAEASARLPLTSARA